MNNVLLVEGNRLLRIMMAAGLGGYGHKVHEAPNIAAAMRLLEDGLQPDVLLLDWHLPDGNAEDLILAAQSVVPSGKLQVFVAAGQPETVTCQADHILSKNSSVVDIINLM